MMQFKNKVTILGAKAVDFKTDDGRHYDHVALYCLIPLDQSQGNSVGNACETFNWQDRTNLTLLRQHKFPLEADITFEMVTSGKTTKYVVKHVELPNPVKSVA
ncbi:hypothetical protein F939_01783 [Acinetobacter radioresistens DSM 6976 = NBRC 102413 = CIP 103788]|jgi:hypothetical protein|uniref:Uncharacterized protein n=1 Tax=Acinetobacter radioresistens SK82 TaxID=596318 RepID=A0ABM9YMI4_ACIRA|nr:MULTISPECIES: hypothetical protein [Acinetobacter]HDG2063247.1 hypothetical protein [Staphylococcus aureus]EET82277.1 hypothetical protein ACIRA0001_2820 [Acinetobacter radioresistens SK82]ENV89060.1 hypothetical protein F939_01783 [Acinetobacter radioresistens DSM 6976 = NBRC 102413 = CIP 103788]EXE53476.1 hypothetical protein J579_3273 [Acinetobacter sp. 1239920]EXE53834.1 hypothetical protein J579_3250 [Acinetobacter sp. 1239920]